MSERLRRLFQRVDQAVEAIREQHGKKVRCKKGCSDCCHAVFDVSLAEAVAIQKAFLDLPRPSRRLAVQQARKAMDKWQELASKGAAVATSRIRCPMLDGDDTCMIYDTRPVNCRTYGVPVEFRGTAAVCGLSGFTQGENLTTIRLEPIQEELHSISTAMDPVIGERRWPICAIILDVA